MNKHTARLIQTLKNTLPAQAAPLVLAALRQDPVVWKSLQRAEFSDQLFNQVSTRGGLQMTEWCPARLALIALSQPYRDKISIADLPQSFCEHVGLSYPNLIQHADEVDLARAGAVAVALAVKNQQSKSWTFLSSEIDEHPSFPWGSVLACLFGMLPDPVEMLANLAARQPSPLRSRLVIHVILCQPSETSSRLDALLAITLGSGSQVAMRPLDMLDFLHHLQHLAPDLAVAYCRKINAQHNNPSHLPKSQPFQQTDILRETATSLFDLEIARLAGDQAKVSLQLDKVLALRNIVAASLLAQVAAMQPVDAEDALSNAHLVANWKKSIELMQTVQPAALIEPFKSGLAQALLKTGKPAEAHALLAGSQPKLIDNPYNLSVLVQAARQNGDNTFARQAGARLAEISFGWDQKNGYIAPHAAIDVDQIADCLISTGMPDEARRVFQNALSEAPNQEGWLEKLAELQSHTRLYHQSAENLQILAGLQPANLQLRHKLARTFEADQDWLAALDEWTSLVEESQYTSQAEELEDIHALAACALKAEMAEPAIHASQRALSLASEDGLAYAYLARAYAMQHDILRGLDYATQATQINPNLPEGWLALADLLSLQGRLQQAIETLQSANQIIPNNAQLLYLLGEYQLRAGNPTIAANALKQAVALDPAQTEYHYTLGRAYQRLGQLANALHELQNAYQAEEVNTDYAAAYGAALLEAGNAKSALQPLTISIQLKESATASSYVNYARAVLELHQHGDPEVTPQAALTAIEQALHRDPELPEAICWLAEALRVCGNLPAAFTAYQQALETPLANGRDWRERLSFGLSQTGYKLGRYDIAIASAQEAISAAPQHAENYKLLADAYLSSSLFEDSLRAARTVLNLNIDNLVNLAWYADHIARLVAHQNAITSPTFAHQARQAVLEAQNALLQAVQLAPDRADLLVKLSKLQQMAGDAPSALQTARLVLANENASQEHLSAAAEQMQALGDIASAVLCLEKAVSREQAKNQIISPDLLIRLANAYVEKGDLSSASDILEQAISIAPDSGNLYYERTILLLNLARTEDAFCCVETGISLARTDAKLPRLYSLAAWLYRLNGDLSSALGYIHKGLEVSQRLAGGSDRADSLPLSDCLMIADLFRALLQPKNAYQMLKSIPAGSGSKVAEANNLDLQWLALKIELEMELGYVPEVKAGEQNLAEEAVNLPGWMAVQARLALRSGIKEQADQYYQAAIRLVQEENAAKASQVGLGRSKVRRSMVSLLEAALEFNDWQFAAEIVRRFREMAPNEPFTHLASARLIVSQAEFQQACQRLEVQQHAPGPEALSGEKLLALKEAIHKASQLVQALEKNNPTYDLAHPITRLERWHARGQIAFYQSTPETAGRGQLNAAVARLKLNPSGQSQTADEAAAVILATQTNGSHDAEQTILAEVLQITRPHSRNAWVWFQAALALEVDYPREAFSAARGAIQLLTCRQSPLEALVQALLGRIALRLNDLPAAHEAIDTALAIWTDESRWQVMAAKIKQALHHPMEGLKHLEQAAQLEASSLVIQLELGKAYLAESNTDPSSLQKAIQCFDTAVHLDPNEVSAWIWLARASLRAKEVEAAEMSVEQILSITPDNSEAAVLQAEIALLKKSYQAAHTFAQTAVQACPEDPKTTLLLARTLKSLNKPSEALQVIESALPISEDPLALQYERAKLLHELHGPEAALRVLTELVLQNPDDANILSSLARSQADLGDVQAATQTALAALKAGKVSLEPVELASIHYLAGTLLRRSGQLDGAIQQLNDAVTLRLDYLDAYLELGLARKERREYQQALQAFEHATKIAPHDPRPHYQAGLALKEGKDYRRSEVMLRQAAHLAPDDVLVRRQLAQVVALNVVHNSRT